MPTVPVVIGDDVEACAEPVRAYAALYVGGMGSREKNLQPARHPHGLRRGCGRSAEQVPGQDIAGPWPPCPLDFIDKTSLIGPRERIRERLHAYADAGVTTLTIAAYAGSLEDRLNTVRAMAELVDEAGLA